MENEKKEKIKNGFKLGGLIVGLIACIGVIAFLIVSIFVRYPNADNVDNSSAPLVYRNLPRNNPIKENYDYDLLEGNTYFFSLGDLDSLAQDIDDRIGSDINDYVNLTLKCYVDLYSFGDYSIDVNKSPLDVIYIEYSLDVDDPVVYQVYSLNSDNSRNYLYTFGNQTKNISIKFNFVEYELGYDFVNYGEFYDYWMNSEDIRYYFTSLNLYLSICEVVNDYKNYQFDLDLTTFNPNYFYSSNSEKLGYWASGLQVTDINTNYQTILSGDFIINNVNYKKIKCEVINLSAARIPILVGTADNSSLVAWVVNQQPNYFTVLTVFADNGLATTDPLYKRVELMYLSSKEIVTSASDVSIITTSAGTNNTISTVFNYNKYFCYYDSIKVLGLKTSPSSVLAYRGTNAKTYYEYLSNMNVLIIYEYNGLNGSNNVFDLFTLAFSSWLPIFKIDIIPGLAIGTLLFIPFVVGLIIVIFKMVVK